MHRAPQSQRTYFLTFVAANRRRIFQTSANAELMLANLCHYRAQGKFSLHAFVIMPDHVHLLITPAEDVSLERAVQLIKGGFSFRLRSKLDVWERGHFGKRISDCNGYEACVRYIEENPVRGRLVSQADLYPFSSANPMVDIDRAPMWLM